MKYTIELTENQKKQMDLLCELAHRYVGFNPKLEPIKIRTTNVEDTNEYQIGYKVGFEDGAKAQNEVQYNKGLEDGYKGYKYLAQWFADTCFYDDEDNLFPEYKRRQADTCCLEDIITDVGFSEVLKRVRAYEEKKKAEEEPIKVGDEVLYGSSKLLVTKITNASICTVNADGKVDTWRATAELIKTGRHFNEVSQLLDMLRGEE